MEPQRPDLADALRGFQQRHPTTALAEPDDFDAGAMPDNFGLRMTQLWREAMPERFTTADLADLADDQLRPDRRAKLAEWAANPQGRNVLLWGPVGCGKTHAAVAACRPALMNRGQDVTFKPVVELMDELRDQGELGACTMAEVRDVDLLVLDDLGGERVTDWTLERMYAGVNRRWLELRPIIGTTNLPLTHKVAPEGYTGATLEEAVGSRTFSRLVGNGALVLPMGGPDRRR